jgi:hypothetical protein
LNLSLSSNKELKEIVFDCSKERRKIVII